MRCARHGHYGGGSCSCGGSGGNGRGAGDAPITSRNHFGRISRHRQFERVLVDQWVRSAVLVESVRTEAGPRHKHICYLGAIREGCEGYDGHRANFWLSAGRNLARAGVPDADRARIVAALEAVVLMPADRAYGASDGNGYRRRIRVGASGAPDSPPRRAPYPPTSGQTALDGNSPTVSATEKKTTIFRQQGSRNRPFPRSPKHLRRDHSILRDLGPR
jgi:hypothetical protein